MGTDPVPEVGEAVGMIYPAELEYRDEDEGRHDPRRREGRQGEGDGGEDEAEGPPPGEEVDVPHQGLDPLHRYPDGYRREGEACPEGEEMVPQSNTALVYMFAETPPISPATASSMKGPSCPRIPGFALSGCRT